MTEQYIPKVGGRVRATIEGVAGNVSSGWFDLGVNCIPMNPERYSGATYAVEKLADYNPEPEWVNGDVVEVVFRDCGPGFPSGPRRAAHVNGRWVMTDTGETAGVHFMTNHWPENVTILYKADQPDAA